MRESEFADNGPAHPPEQAELASLSNARYPYAVGASHILCKWRCKCGPNRTLQPIGNLVTGILSERSPANLRGL